MPNWKKVIVSGSDASLSTLTITNSGSTDDSLLLTATEDSSTAAPVVTFKRNSGTPADADYLGQLKFKGENDADQEVVYAKITAKIQDASDGSEDGLIEFANKKAGSNVITARLRSDSLQLLNDSNLTVDGQISASSLISNNFSGSFQGDGSSLTGVTADGTVSGSAQTVANLSNQDVDFGTGAVTASNIQVANQIVHIGDTDTYLQFAGANDFRVIAGGIDAVKATASEIAFNDGQANYDFRVEGDSEANLIFADASTDRVGIGTNSPSHTLTVEGTVSGSFVGDGSGLTGISADIVSSSTVSDTFTSATTHSVSHTLGTKDVIVNVYDGNDDIFVPTRINTPTTSSVVIYMDPATSGRVVIGKSGHVVSGSTFSGSYSGSFEGLGSGLTNVTSSKAINTRDDSSLSFWAGSQAQYDALSSYDSNTLYFVT